MKIRYAPNFIQTLDRQVEYISKDKPSASRRFNPLHAYNIDIEATLFKYYSRKFTIDTFIYKYFFKFIGIGNTFRTYFLNVFVLF